MASGIKVHIYGDYTDKDIKRAQRDLESLKTTTGTTSAAFGYLKTAAVGAAIAAGAMAIKFGVDGVQAFIADEEAAAKLAQTMNNLGLAHDTDAVEAMIDALQRETGVADDELRPAYGRLVTSLGDTAKATSSLKLAMDISAGTGKSLDTVVQALGKAYDGNVGGLQRLGIGLDKSILKTGDMQVITAALAEKFAGQAATAADTYQGKINRLSVGFNELQESFGAGFLMGLSGAQTGIGDVTTSMEEMQPTLQTLGETIGETIVATLQLTKMAIDAKTAFDDWKESSGALGDAVGTILAPLGLITGGIIAVRDAAVAAEAAIRRLMGSQNEGRVLAQIAVNAGDGNAPRPEYDSQVPTGARANGGPVSAGGTYLVGEKGPEILTMGSMSGYVHSNDSIRAAAKGGNSYTINLAATPGTDKRRLGQELVEAIRAFEKANGNVFAAA